MLTMSEMMSHEPGVPAPTSQSAPEGPTQSSPKALATPAESFKKAHPFGVSPRKSAPDQGPVQGSLLLSPVRGPSQPSSPVRGPQQNPKISSLLEGDVANEYVSRLNYTMMASGEGTTRPSSERVAVSSDPASTPTMQAAKSPRGPNSYPTRSPHGSPTRRPVEKLPVISESDSLRNPERDQRLITPCSSPVTMLCTSPETNDPYKNTICMLRAELERARSEYMKVEVPDKAVTAGKRQSSFDSSNHQLSDVSCQTEDTCVSDAGCETEQCPRIEQECIERSMNLISEQRDAIQRLEEELSRLTQDTASLQQRTSEEHLRKYKRTIEHLKAGIAEKDGLISKLSEDLKLEDAKKKQMALEMEIFKADCSAKVSSVVQFARFAQKEAQQLGGEIDKVRQTMLQAPQFRSPDLVPGDKHHHHHHHHHGKHFWLDAVLSGGDLESAMLQAACIRQQRDDLTCTNPAEVPQNDSPGLDGNLQSIKTPSPRASTQTDQDSELIASCTELIDVLHGSAHVEKAATCGLIENQCSNPSFVRANFVKALSEACSELEEHPTVRLDASSGIWKGGINQSAPNFSDEQPHSVLVDAHEYERMKVAMQRAICALQMQRICEENNQMQISSLSRQVEAMKAFMTNLTVNL